jgi:hypothetical protein
MRVFPVATKAELPALLLDRMQTLTMAAGLLVDLIEETDEGFPTGFFFYSRF